MLSVTLIRERKLYFIGTVILFSFLMCLSSFVRIPLIFSPVPITLQTLILFLSLVLLQDKSFWVQMFYVIIGASGFPVFGNAGAGLMYLLGPTGGYLAGFILGSLLGGKALNYLINTGKTNFISLLVTFSVVNVVIYLMGIGWLMFSFHINLVKALYIGMVPFVSGDILKIVVASFIGARFLNTHI